MLYVVGTPIGNLEDLSVRQVRTIAQAEILLTEDTRTTGLLLKKITELFKVQINPHQRLISYYKENEFEKLPEILDWIRDEKEVALISEAGMPLISDPGYFLVKNVIKGGMPFTVIPGPTASITALVQSGLNPAEHIFLGFLPKKSSEKIKVLNKIQKIKEIFPKVSVIFYESPERIHETLQLIAQHMPSVDLSVSRELTKKFEETLRGKAEDLLNHTYKGELTVVLN